MKIWVNNNKFTIILLPIIMNGLFFLLQSSKAFRINQIRFPKRINIIKDGDDARLVTATRFFSSVRNEITRKLDLQQIGGLSKGISTQVNFIRDEEEEDGYSSMIDFQPETATLEIVPIDPPTIIRAKTSAKAKKTYVKKPELLSQKEIIQEKISENQPQPQPKVPLVKTPVTIIETVKQAKAALKILQKNSQAVWACDTEVVDIDIKEQGPIGNGKVICVSIYGGDDIDFGQGSTLWIDSSDRYKTADGKSEVLTVFKSWFEDSKHQKVWHNYGFDRHVLANEGINCQGFAGDTMHMARLWDTSRDKLTGNGDGYSLAALTEFFFMNKDRNDENTNNENLEGRFVKTSMKDLFGVAKLKKDGTESKIKELPDLLSLQQNPSTREAWIEYSARDAVATWWVRERLVQRLKQMAWVIHTVDYNNNQVKSHNATFPSGEEGPKTLYRNAKTLNGNGNGNGKSFKETTTKNLLGTMYDFYNLYLKDFGELLTDMEKNGIKVNKNLLQKSEQLAREEKLKYEKLFISWAKENCNVPDNINIASTAQMQQLFFGHYENGQLIGQERSFRYNKTDDEYQLELQQALKLNRYVSHDTVDIKTLVKERGLKTSGTRKDLMLRLLNYDNVKSTLSNLSLSGVLDRCRERQMDINSYTPEDLTKEQLIEDYLNYEISLLKKKKATPTVREVEVQVDLEGSSQEDQKKKKKRAPKKVVEPVAPPPVSLFAEIPTSLLEAAEKSIEEGGIPMDEPKKYLDITITTLGMEPTEYTATGLPQVNAAVLKKLSGKDVFGEDPKWGTAYDFFGQGERGKAACQAIGALALLGQVDTTIASFLVPLQQLADENDRIHCSLNLNTETGRLSSRRPNLQNQPALEKDHFKIRDAFVAEENKTFIVADYGQLELRILAHITNCKSMIHAFSAGGCFHSRTAMGMYPYIREAVDSGAVVLEWDYSKGQPTVPLVKDQYGSERRKAKILNFSIAYGKTVHGLAQDWGISKEEAEKTLNAWYNDRPEVKQWQQQAQDLARTRAFVRTIMGRYRRIPGGVAQFDERGRMIPGSASQIGHAMRAAINTPIQGSAADIVMMAMLKLWKSEKLKELGWKLLLQIHDEVILEGPIESRDEAMKEVRHCMENPFDNHGLSKLLGKSDDIELYSRALTLSFVDCLVHLDVDAKSADSWYKAK